MRKFLPHEVPPNLHGNSGDELFFITICCEPRGLNQLANAEIWQALLDTIEHRENTGVLECRLLLAMPDHLHGLLRFPLTSRMKATITAAKSWLARNHGIRWQRDFFDHRLRDHESANEKRNYILMNPVRAGLVATPQEWPFRRESGGTPP